MNEIIFETVHGSHLYGLAHDGSDHDVFRVTTSTRPRAKHFERGAEDVCEVGITVFLERALAGSHQSVEALFSPRKEWRDTRYRALVENTRVTGADVFAKYERTIRKFAYGDFKRRRHACRLALNLDGLRRDGRFEPVMTDIEKVLATKLATQFEGEELLEHIFGKE